MLYAITPPAPFDRTQHPHLVGPISTHPYPGCQLIPDTVLISGKYASKPTQNGSDEYARTKVLMKGKHASEHLQNAIAGDVELNLLRRGKRDFNRTLNVAEKPVRVRVMLIGRTSYSAGIALQRRQANLHYLGAMTVLSTDCLAKQFEAENSSTHPGRFMQCCNLGRTRLQKFQGYPDTIRNNILMFNTALGMASMGAQVVQPSAPEPYCFRIYDQTYYCIGPLPPEEGQLRQHGQIYILECSKAAQKRNSNVQNTGCDAGVMMTLSRLISEINPYAQAFKMTHEVEMLGELRSRKKRRPSTRLKMVFEESRERCLSRCRYDVPTTSVPKTKVFLLIEASQFTKGKERCSNSVTSMKDAILLHTFLSNWRRRTNNKRLNQMKNYSCPLPVRGGECSPLLHGEKLLQQFIADAYVRVEQNRLHCHRTHQKELRVDSYRGLGDYLSEDNENFSGPPRRGIVLASSFMGGPRTSKLSRRDGSPWDRPDITTRVFKLKHRRSRLSFLFQAASARRTRAPAAIFGLTN
ncbi:unnamed protein product [Heligmosomoides polygyrus]|uniref:Helitron_like_N domain-containing protein n=1 Tax=Heligmosomoides polygyrus TaxID=6339 RepID=A0A3P8BCF8_HELPZ|nr:unnamed protein product [Heligmosomoides polygyrus]